jgi:glycosyltransferase involved in cell wall biosynthesis
VATVRATLESVKWADEILVVDSFSTDETPSICRGYGARVIQHEYLNSASQKNWALPQCRNDWVLQIDTDEVLGPGLREEIETVVASAPSGVQAFRVPRRNHFLGKWIRYGGLYPDYQIRLLRRDSAVWQDREVHAHAEVPGTVGTLQRYVLHNDAPTIATRIRNLDRYTRYEADELRKRGRRFRWHDLVIRPWVAFGYRYLWLGGFKDGWRGFICAVYAAMYVFLSRAKLWELDVLDIERSPRS